MDDYFAKYNHNTPKFDALTPMVMSQFSVDEPAAPAIDAKDDYFAKYNQPTVSSAEDSAKSILPGLASGAAGILSPIRRLAGISYLGRVLGLKADEGDEEILRKHPILGPVVRALVTPVVGISAAFSPAAYDLAQHAPALEKEAASYEPQTLAGDITKTAASMLPNAIGGGETIPLAIARGVARVALPTAGEVIAGQATHGTPAEKYARPVGALIGGLTEAGRELATDAAHAAVISPNQKKALDFIHTAAGGPLDIDPREIVPGSEPSLLEATTDNNPGLAQLHRSISDIAPSGPSRLVANQLENHKARRAYFDQLAGTPGDVESAKLARDTVTEPMRDAAFAGAKAAGKTADASGAERTIYNILKSRQGKRSVVEREMNDVLDKLQIENPLKERVADALPSIKAEIDKPGVGADRRADLVQARRLLISASRGFTTEDELIKALGALSKKSKIVSPIDDALKIIKSGSVKLESDPDKLYGVVQHINDRLSKLAPSDAKDAQLAAAQLAEVKKSLDNAIEGAASGYKDYKSTFEELSKPIDKMEFLQQASVADQYGNLTLAKVNNLLTNIKNARAFKGGVHPAKSLSDDDLAALENLKEDLTAAAKTSTGRANGSNTFQNLTAAAKTGLTHAVAGRSLEPEVIGGSIGGIVGGAIGHPEIGAAIGAGTGRTVNAISEAKHAEVAKEIEKLLADPAEYLKAADAAKKAAAGRGILNKTPALVLPVMSAAEAHQRSKSLINAQ